MWVLKAFLAAGFYDYFTVCKRYTTKITAKNNPPIPIMVMCIVDLS